MENSSMKQILKHIINTSVLFLTGIVLAGCSSSDAPIEQPINPTGKYVMTVNASKGSDATTRALTIGGSSGKKLIAYWDGTEKVTVKEGATPLGTLTTITPDATDNTKAKLSGTLDKAPSGTSLTLELCSPTYGSQDGTLAYIASNCDYATATTTVTYDNDNKTITGNASFINQQAIVKFTLKDIYGFPIKANRFTISSGNDKIVQNIDQDNFTYGSLKLTIDPASETGELYTAIRHNLGTSETDDITLTAVEINHDSCVYQKSGVKFESGYYYSVNVIMKSAMLSEPLTLEATENGTQITFINYASNSVYYRINQGKWTEIPSTGSNQKSITDLKKGDIVSFKGTNSTYYGGEYSPSIACSNPCYVYGNMMSMVDATNFVSLTTLPEGSDTFRGFFMYNTDSPDEQNSHLNLINHPTKDLLLPATTLRDGCYKSMFAGCQKLTRAPVLPAAMLVANCYAFMFDGCSSLAYIKCLATDISATNCTQKWVNNVSASGTFVKAPGMTSWTTDKDGIPWSVSP